ncbi:uncharacterized protein LOC134462986 [Engraulis encrasicolus]|uniref:uncharacterized protein LOC134462986 n=1 Tax=Engraulis encrasicolus TaxID=184585 RepID=UPI002FD2AF2E
MVPVSAYFDLSSAVATTTDTTDVAAQYPQNPTATQHNPDNQPYSGYPQNPTATQQYPGYQPGNPQLGYGTPAPYGGQPMVSAPQPGPPSALFEPPPSYQDAVGGSPVFNCSGAAFTPCQQSYPIQHPVHAGYHNRPASPATAPTASADFLAQTAYNPNYATPPP